jgi:hypothetical protein
MLKEFYLVSVAAAVVAVVLIAVLLWYYYDSHKVKYHAFFYIFEKDLEDPFQSSKSRISSSKKYRKTTFISDK